jgi:hypothetical protein
MTEPDSVWDDDDEPVVQAADVLDGQTGKMRVLAEQCATCIFRPGNLMQLRDGALKALTEGAADTFVTCHDTLPNWSQEQPAVCRGFYDGYAEKSRTLQVLVPLFGGVELVPPPVDATKERTQ